MRRVYIKLLLKYFIYIDCSKALSYNTIPCDASVIPLLRRFLFSLWIKYFIVRRAPVGEVSRPFGSSCSEASLAPQAGLWSDGSQTQTRLCEITESLTADGNRTDSLPPNIYQSMDLGLRGLLVLAEKLHLLNEAGQPELPRCLSAFSSQGSGCCFFATVCQLQTCNGYCLLEPTTLSP